MAGRAHRRIATFSWLRALRFSTLWLLPLGCAGIALLLRLALGAQTIDDAYITFRYARNLADGQGFVYNLGDHVLGTSTPLYTLLLAVLYRLTHISLPLISSVIGVLCAGLTTILIWFLVLRATGNRLAATLAALLAATMPGSIYYGQSGMETAFFTLLLIAGTWFYLSNDQLPWGTLIGLAALTRPEGALFALLFIAYDLWTFRRIPWKALASFVAVTIPWLVWATWYFGSPLPLSVLTKVQAHVQPVTVIHASTIPLSGIPLGNGHEQIGLLILVVLFPAAWFATTPRLRPVFAACGLLVLGWTIAKMRGSPVVGWYFVPAATFAAIAIAVGADMICRVHPTRQVVLAAFSAILVQAQLGQTVEVRPALHVAVISVDSKADSRLTTYHRICRLLAPRLYGNDLIATPEIGVVGYECPTRILDTIGLVSPGTARYADTDDLGHIHPALVAAFKPNYVMGLSVFVAPLLTDAGFLRQYHQILWLPEATFGSHGFYVFARR